MEARRVFLWASNLPASIPVPLSDSASPSTSPRLQPYGVPPSWLIVAETTTQRADSMTLLAEADHSERVVPARRLSFHSIVLFVVFGLAMFIGIRYAAHRLRR